MTEREKWNNVAIDYQRVYDLGLSEYNTSLLRFWQEKAMLYPGARVIDIGCGVGRYGTLFAELGCDVTLTDISDEMLKHAAENMSKYSTPWSVFRCDFNEITGKEAVFEKGFDFAISTMSPAIHDGSTVFKMSKMTRGWCFLARFYDWKQPYRDSIMRRLDIEPKIAFGDLKGDCDNMLKAVKEAGFIPELTYADYNWADPRTPEQMADYMKRSFYLEDDNRDELGDRILSVARSDANDNGVVIDAVNTKVAWIYWNTKA